MPRKPSTKAIAEEYARTLRNLHFARIDVDTRRELNAEIPFWNLRARLDGRRQLAENISYVESLLPPYQRALMAWIEAGQPAHVGCC